MASTSTSSVAKSFKYDVFLSFSSKDTRRNFIDHLYSALQIKNIRTYKDDEKIDKGKWISDELMGSIELSKFYIIVFSKNYASSSWCLDELVKIMECHKTTERTVYPVFYDVEPLEVRCQIGAVGEAFARHEKEGAAGKWRVALKEATDVAGWELKNTADGHEAKFIRQIVEKLSLELRSINFRIDKNLVGMENRINDIVSSLGTASDDVRMIGIWGIGGGGKTTLARAVFNKLYLEFEGKSFIENVREESKASVSGLKSLQKQILSNVLDNQPINVGSIDEGKSMMSWMMHGRKLLLVLDDVDHIDQLEALAGDPNWFMPGSIIIITTREKQVLVAHGVKIHNVNLLSDKEANWLFSRYAFGKEIPIQGYEELSRQVVCYAAGLPLTIKVLGSFLCGKSKLEWADALARLQTIPLDETQKKLEVSYIGLDDELKEIFLDVATILKGWLKNSVIEALESCGFYARIGLIVLEQKSLITIDDNECVGMHDHLEEMGRNIVRRSHPDMPYKHSRLWDSKEIEDILANDLGTEATRCIQFDYEVLDPEIIMKGLGKMKELRFLQLTKKFDSYSNREINMPITNFLMALGFLCCNWKFNKVSPYFPDALRYVHWNGYPFRYLPKTFQANNLVALQMNDSDIVQLWERGEKKVLNKLKFLYLSGPKLRSLDLGLTPNLETLTLEGHGHDNLVELYMPGELLKLRSLKLDGVKLRTFDLGLTPNLENLCLRGGYLVELHMPNIFLNLKSLLLSYLNLRTLDIGLTPNLENLCLRGCDLIELHIPCRCLNLKSVELCVLKLRTLELGLTPNLEELNIYYCNDLEELHMAHEYGKLTSLQLEGLKLRTLDLGSSPILTYIKIRYSKLRTLDLRLVPNLNTLLLSQCKDLVELYLPSRCINLNALRCTNLKLRTLELGHTPNLKELDLKECYNLVELHAPIGWLKNIVYLDLSGCLVFRSFLFHLKDNIVNDSLEVRPLAELHFTLKVCPFHPDNNFLKFEFTRFHKKDRSSLTRSIEELISGGPCVCTKHERFSRSIRSLQR